MPYLLKQWRFSKKIIFTIVSIASSSFKILYLFCHNLKFKFCCQFYDAIFPPKTVKIEKQNKNIGFFEIQSSTILQRLTSNEQKMQK